MIEDDKKGAAVKFPPPVVVLIFMLIGYGLNYFYPLTLIESTKAVAFSQVGYAIVALGLIIELIAFFTFRKAKTTIEPWKPTSNIISNGIFSYSRNPIYVAFSLIVIGFGFAHNNLWVVLSFLPAMVGIYHIAIKKEERYLEEKFGDEYLLYKSKVRRWI